MLTACILLGSLGWLLLIGGVLWLLWRRVTETEQRTQEGFRAYAENFKKIDGGFGELAKRLDKLEEQWRNIPHS